MSLPIRKQIRLKGFDYSQGNAYFVTICTYKRMHLFGEIVGAAPCGCPNNPSDMIEKWLMKIEDKYANAIINKFVIMPDHIHFILYLTGDHIGSPLPQIIDWFKTMTTNDYIKGVKNGIYLPFDKHIWQRNYYEHIIRNETDYQEIWLYIDNNPLKQKNNCI